MDQNRGVRYKPTSYEHPIFDKGIKNKRWLETPFNNVDETIYLLAEE